MCWRTPHRQPGIPTCRTNRHIFTALKAISGKMTPFSRPAFRDTFVWKYGWRRIQTSRGLSEVMRYRKPVFAIDYHAVGIS
jgi:hypothetical protein